MQEAKNSFELDVEGICVHVTRKRVKNVNFRIGPHGEALMSIPWHLSREQAERVARDHATWFRERLQKVRSQRTSPLSWETGDPVRVWGEELTLRVKEGENLGCERCGGELVVTVRAGSLPAEREMVVEQWLSDQFRACVERLLPACEERVGRRATSITLRRMKTRWGSCSTGSGRIRLNTALVECPEGCTQMVIVHELCHLWEANHGTRFYALMDLHCPDWRVWQAYLKEHPPRS